MPTMICGGYWGRLRVTDEALIAETAVDPTSFLCMFSLLLKDLNFSLLFFVTAAGCCAVWRP